MPSESWSATLIAIEELEQKQISKKDLRGLIVRAGVIHPNTQAGYIANLEALGLLRRVNKNIFTITKPAKTTEVGK